MKTLLKPIFVLLGLITFLHAQSDPTRVLAIPLFTNHTGNVEYDWLNEALADMLTTDIASIKSITIVNRLHLKKLINEQKLSQTGLIQDDEKVLIGRMVGAKQIVTGSYSVIGGNIRIDAQLFDSEQGIALGAASIQGNLDEIFILEKRLALKLLDILQIEVSDEDKIQLLQVESNKIEAIENNYKGVLALETNDIKQAKKYFETATEVDPYYKKAKINLESISIAVEGKTLFGDALSELNKKDEQLKQLKHLTKEFVDSYYSITISDKPEIITNSQNKDIVNLKVTISVEVNLRAVKKYIDQLMLISEGDQSVFFDLSRLYKYDKEKQSFGFNLYKENEIWYKENYIHNVMTSSGGLYLWFPKLKILQLKIGNNIVDEKKVWFRVGSIGWTRILPLSEPWIYCHKMKNKDDRFNRENKIVSLAKYSIIFKNVSMEQLAQIDKVEFINPPIISF